MRVRLQILLPLAAALVVAAGFMAAAVVVADGVRDALLTVPGLTRERAVESAVAAVALTGVVVTALATVLAAWLARRMVRPLGGLRRAADRLADPRREPVPPTRLVEIQDLARALARAGEDLRSRLGRETGKRRGLATLVEAVSEGILQVDEGGVVVRANRACRTLLSLPADARGRPVATLLRNDDLRGIMERGAAGRGDVAEVALDDRRLLVSTSPQDDGGVVATFVDLTDLRRLEDVRRDFVANASHELKTPLTSIRGYTETLLSGDVPAPERREFLEILARNAERLQRIVDDLLDLSRLEAGRWEPDLTAVAVGVVAENAWAGIADRAARRRIRFRATADDGHDTARVDPAALQQIFTNLYDNAIRHTPEEGTVRVTVRREGGDPERAALPSAGGESEGGDRVVVEVSDTGTGIPSDELPRIFERFYRVDPARSRAEGGTGLGLSIVKHLVEAMGGTVSAESVLGRGTTIRLRLPAA